MEAGDLNEAEEWFLRALERKEQTLGPDDLSTLRTVGIIASILQDQSTDLESARLMYERVLEGYDKYLKPPEGCEHHPDMLHLLMSYGHLLYNQNKFVQAEIYTQRACDGLLHEFGPEHVSTLTALNNLADIFSDSGQAEKSFAKDEQVLLGREKVSVTPSCLLSINYGLLNSIEYYLRLSVRIMLQLCKLLVAWRCYC